MYRIAVVIALLTLLLSGCDRGTRPGHIGTPAPDFTVKDDDRKVTLSDLRGKVVVLNFWASWCVPCQEETPSLVAMQRKLQDKGVVVLAVSVDEDESMYHKFLKAYNVDLLTVRDPAQNTSRLYGTSVFPESYVIDRDGRIRRKVINAIDWTQPEIVEFLSKL